MKKRFALVDFYENPDGKTIAEFDEIKPGIINQFCAWRKRDTDGECELYLMDRQNKDAYKLDY